MRISSRSLLALAALLAALAASCSDDDPGASGSGGGPPSGSGSSSTTAASGGSGGNGGGAGGMGGGGDISELSDPFDGSALDPSWTVYNADSVDVSVEGGSLVLRTNQLVLWFQGSEGVVVYKLVRGDFKVTSTVQARKASSPADPPDDYVHLGGLMARSPASDGTEAPEDYVFIVVGNDENDLSVETKITENSMSTYDGPTWPSGDAELRLCRVGGMFHLYKRPIGGATWEAAAAFEDNLPDEIQVGPNIYSGAAPPDLQVSYGEVVFAPAASEADCMED
jgi:hypothetical protein